jgi:glyceraldehyde-3-phosphate dehydrogenase/erythrose-4-phosphate dehydrogenase
VSRWRAAKHGAEVRHPCDNPVLHALIAHPACSGILVKVCSWYDNEWGFPNRMLDTTLALMAAK